MVRSRFAADNLLSTRHLLLCAVHKRFVDDRLNTMGLYSESTRHNDFLWEIWGEIPYIFTFEPAGEFGRIRNWVRVCGWITNARKSWIGHIWRPKSRQKLTFFTLLGPVMIWRYTCIFQVASFYSARQWKYITHGNTTTQAWTASRASFTLANAP